MELDKTRTKAEEAKGVTKDSSVRATTASGFVCCFESKWLKDSPCGLKHLFDGWYIDNMFLLFSALDYAEALKEYFFI